MQTLSAKTELAQDDGRDLCCCHKCWTFHFDSDRACPECGAGIYYQCWTTKDGNAAASFENYASAYASKAARLRRQADACDARAELHRANTEFNSQPVRTHSLCPTQ